MDTQNNPLKESTWEEFRSSGFLWWINSLLHLFGWCIVYEFEDNSDKIKRVYPAKTSFRGFSEKSNDEGYRAVTNYMVQNSEELLINCPKDEE